MAIIFKILAITVNKQRPKYFHSFFIPFFSKPSLSLPLTVCDLSKLQNSRLSQEFGGFLHRKEQGSQEILFGKIFVTFEFFPRLDLKINSQRLVRSRVFERHIVDFSTSGFFFFKLIYLNSKKFCLKVCIKYIYLSLLLS